MNSTLRGVISAIATPVDAAFAPDAQALLAHARELLAGGCDGLNLLGTTGGAASFSLAQRLALMEQVAASELPLERVMVGTGAAALDDAVRLTRAAVELGYAGALIIPPFYYKDVDEDGIAAYYSRIVEAVGSNALRLYFYHFPRLSGVPISVPLVQRLARAYPATVAGIKDSAGDPELLAELHLALPHLDLFPASEAALLQARALGYAGCISATANVTAGLASQVWNERDPATAQALQARVTAQRNAIGSLPLIPAIHQLVYERQHDPAWLRALPPLSPLRDDEIALLHERLGALGVVG